MENGVDLAEFLPKEYSTPFSRNAGNMCHSGVCTLNILLVGKLLVIIILKVKVKIPKR